MSSKTTAVLLLDFQNEFACSGGKLHESVSEVMKSTRMLEKVPPFVKMARENGATIIYSPVSIGVGSHFVEEENDPQAYSAMKGLFEEGTWNAEIVNELKPTNEDVILTGRNNFSAFQGTQLEKILREKNIDRVFVAGFLTNVCVLNTVEEFEVLGLQKEGIEIIVLEDGCSAKTIQEHKNAISLSLALHCETVTCQNALVMLKAGKITNDRFESDLEMGGSSQKSSRLTLTQQRLVTRRLGYHGDKQSSTRIKRMSLMIRNATTITNQETITKSELEVILLKCTGLVVGEQVLHDIFKRAGTFTKDKQPSLSPEQISSYIDRIGPISILQRRKWIARKLLVSLSFWFSFMFFLGGIFGITAGLRTRSFGDLYNTTHYFWQVPAWLWQIGSLGFVFNAIDLERLTLRRYIKTCRKLVQWIRSDLPSLYAKLLVKQSRLRHSVALKAERLTIGRFVKHVENDLLDEEVLDAKKLDELLESMGIFLAHDELAYIITKIERHGQRVTAKSLMEFSRTMEKKLLGRKEGWDLMKRCITKIGFWTSFLYVLGTVPWVALDFVNWDPVGKQLNGVSCILYFIGALGGYFSLYESEYAFVRDMEDIDQNLRSVAIKNGLLLSLFEKNLVRESTVRGVKDDDMKILNIDEINSFQAKGAFGLFDLESFKSLEQNIGSSELKIAFESVAAKFDRLWGNFMPSEGKVSKEDIIAYILNIEAFHSDYGFRDILNPMTKSVGFWLVSLQVISASLSLTVAYNTFENNDKINPNLSLVSMIGWTVSSMWPVLMAWVNCSRRLDQLLTNERLLKESMLGGLYDESMGKNDSDSDIESLVSGFRKDGSNKKGLQETTKSSRELLSKLRKATSSRSFFEGSVKTVGFDGKVKTVHLPDTIVKTKLEK